MHLLVTQPGEIADGEEAIDLGQSPGDIIVLSAATTDLSLLVNVHAEFDVEFPSLRLANLLQLRHNMSVDIYLENTLSYAKLIIVKLLGGISYWTYGIEQIENLARAKGIKLAVIPGDDQPDSELGRISTLPTDACHRLWQYGVQGGPDNAKQFLHYAASLAGQDREWLEPIPLIRAGLYWPSITAASPEQIRAAWQKDAPITAIVFYRALLQAGNLKPINAMIEALQSQGLNPLPIFTASLKEPIAAEIIKTILADMPPDIILNCTGFAVSTPGVDTISTPYTPADCPVLQVVLSGGDKNAWMDGTRGLSPTDLAMNVALPEVDGRILSRAVSFKAPGRFDEATQTTIVEYEPVLDRIKFLAELAYAWAKLRKTKTTDRRVAIVLANYPNKDGRLGNGVGLDTPAGVAVTLTRLHEEGYDTGLEPPLTGADLIEILLAGPTNAPGVRKGKKILSLPDYLKFFGTLPKEVQRRMIDRWGPPETDPFVVKDNFILPIHCFGNIIIGVQPARGYNIDPTESYHDPDLVPPHGYLAFYAWIRNSFCAHAIIHFGKHGNLEWLPGKAVSLSEECFPEVVLGPLPHLYPFIVNDPGEGTQAKRRSQAIIIDHLTPPMTRAESYGPLRDLEQLVDEYYQAAGMDPRRLKVLGKDILDLSADIGLDKDIGIITSDDENVALGKLDNYLCELKELQIRDGLHIFGKSPEGHLETGLLVALARLPRGDGKGENDSIIRALSTDLGLGKFDPLDCAMGDPWKGPTPKVLEDQTTDPWRTFGDTVERLELLAQVLVARRITAAPEWNSTINVLKFVEASLRPTLESCGESELSGLITGLDGRFVAPGPSGAPTRGRPDVLPTGRNFYSVDNRAIPTLAAWKLGWKSATLLIEHHFQEQGEFPKRMALSAWGTSNMRTGGDDIAQALALMGVQPVWDQNAHRGVTGFEIMPLGVLGRPRVDVVFRVSGFFRDAFPAQVNLIDSAARAIAALDEPADLNPLAAQVSADAQSFCKNGMNPKSAQRRAAFRVFGSKPGAYGAGLQALIDERCWETDSDLAEAYLAWGGYAYGDGSEGDSAGDLFKARLAGVQIVVQNQDNREHDILDSDDYYQFEGGITAAVRHLSGAQPTIYHNDHSRPESPRIRTLSDEIGRVVRARAANPKWITGVMRHGYKGAFEMAATVDYLFAFAATARVVEDHHFDQLFDAYIGTEEVRDFINEHNPAALKEMAERFGEAIQRNLWKPRSNSVHTLLNRLIEGEAP
jgi:cobaltochelatase CobN